MITTAYKFEANVKDVIRLKEEFRKVRAELDALTKSTKAYKATSKNLQGIGASLDKAKTAAQGTTQATQNLNRAGGNLINTFKSAAVAIMAAFAFRAIIGGLKSVVTTFKDFEAQMAAVKAISGATADEFTKLEESARRYGKTTVFTATQVAGLQEEFARLGFTTPEILAATRATLDLAAATGESLSNSAAVAGSTLRAFGMDAGLTVEVADTMAAAFTGSALTLERFTESMKFVAPVARATGFTLQETTAILAQLADAGIKGSIAGNSLKNIMLKLADENSKIAKTLGGPIQGTEQLAAALEKLKEEGFSATQASEMLGQRAAPAFLALIESADGLRETTEILNNAEGAVTEMAAIRLDTLQGDMTLLKSASEGVALALGEEFKVSLRNIVFSLTEFLQRLSESPVAIYFLKKGLQALAVVVTTLMARFAAQGIVTFIGSIRAAATSIITMLTPAIRGATVAQQGLNTAVRMNPFVAVTTLIAGVASAYFFMGEEMSEAEMKQRRLNKAMKEELNLTLELQEGTSKRAEQIRSLKDNLGDIADEMDIEIASNEQLEELYDFIDGTDQLSIDIANLKGQIDQAEVSLSRFGGTDLATLRKGLADIGRLDMLRVDGSISLADLNKIRYELVSVQRIAAENLLKYGEIAQEEMRSQLKKLQKQRDIEFRNTKIFMDLRLGIEDTYRVKQRKLLEEELEDFRNMSLGKQKRRLKDMEEQKQQLEWLEDYADMVKLISETDKNQNPTIYGRLLKEKKELLAEGKAAGFDIMAEFEQATKDGMLGKNSIILSLLDSFIVRFKGALKVGGDSVTKFADIIGVKLRKTKDVLKELMKGLADGIEDSITNQIVDLKINYNFEIGEIDEEMELINANIADISAMRKDGTQGELAAMIEANRKKFHVLESLTNEEFEFLTKSAEELSKMNEAELITHGEEVLRITQLMIDEEQSKLTNHMDLKAQITANYYIEIAELRRQNQHEMVMALNEQAKLELNTMNQNEFSLFKNFKKNRKLREQALEQSVQHVNDIEADALAQNQKSYDDGLLSWSDFQTNKTRIEANANVERQKLRNDANEQDVEALQEVLARVQEYYSMATDALFNFMQNRIEIRRQEINDEFTNDQEKMNDSMEAELEAAEGNAEQQENIRKHYDAKMLVLEDQKNEKLRKLKKKEFYMQKANDIVMAIINGAVAITTVAKQTGIGAIAAAPLMSALVAAQIASIAAQKFVGAKGGVIPDIPEFGGGGMVYGPSHAQGGVKFNAGGRVVELEGGEAVINKRSTNMFREQLSAMNVMGGGVKFADGGVTPGTSNMIQSASSTNKVALSPDDIAQIVGGINDKTVTVTESAITDTQNNVSISELTSSIF